MRNIVINIEEEEEENPTLPNRIPSTIDLEPDIATSGDHDEEVVAHDNNNGDEENMTKKKKRPNLLWLLLYVFSIPIFVLLIASVMGGILALIENASFVDCMLYVASNLLGLTNPLTDFSPDTGFGVVVDVYVGVMSLIIIGIVLEYVGIFEIPARIDELMERLPCVDSHHKLRKTLIAFTIIIPSAIVLISSFFGAVMAAVEGWTVREGILYVLGNLLGLANPLTDVMPDSIGGDLLDIWISSHALACLALFIDYVTTVDPAKFLRKKAKAYIEPKSSIMMSLSTRLAPMTTKNTAANKEKKQIDAGGVLLAPVDDDFDEHDHEDLSCTA